MKNKVLNSVVMDVGISEQLPLLTKTKKDKVSPQMSPDIKRIDVRSQNNHNFASPVSPNINTTLINLNPSLDDDKQTDAKSISSLSSVHLIILVIKVEEPEGVITLIVLHLQPVWKEQGLLM